MRSRRVGLLVAVSLGAPSPTPSLIPAQLVAFALLGPTALFALRCQNIPNQSTPVKPDEPEMCGNLWYLLRRRLGQPDPSVAVGRMPRHCGGCRGRGGFEAAKAQNSVFILMKLQQLLCYIPSNVVSLLMSLKIHFRPGVRAADLPYHIASRCPGGRRASGPRELLTPLLGWQSRSPR